MCCHPSTTISLCSGYGTETSDSSSDTDIDAVVNEYREEASLPTTMRECSRSDLELKGRGCQLDDTGPAFSKIAFNLANLTCQLVETSNMYLIKISYPIIVTSRRHLMVEKRATMAYLLTKFQFLRTSFDKCKLKMVRNRFFFQPTDGHLMAYFLE